MCRPRDEMRLTLLITIDSRHVGGMEREKIWSCLSFDRVWTSVAMGFCDCRGSFAGISGSGMRSSTRRLSGARSRVANMNGKLKKDVLLDEVSHRVVHMIATNRDCL